MELPLDVDTSTVIDTDSKHSPEQLELLRKETKQMIAYCVKKGFIPEAKKALNRLGFDKISEVTDDKIAQLKTELAKTLKTASKGKNDATQ